MIEVPCSDCGNTAQHLKHNKWSRAGLAKCFSCQRLQGIERSKLQARKRMLGRNNAEVINNVRKTRKRFVRNHIRWCKKNDIPLNLKKETTDEAD